MKEWKKYSAMYLSISIGIKKILKLRTLLVFVFACALSLSVFSISGGEALFEPLFDSLYAGRNVNMVSFDPYFQRQDDGVGDGRLWPRIL